MGGLMNKKYFLLSIPILMLTVSYLLVPYGHLLTVVLFGVLLVINFLFYGIAMIWWICYLLARGRTKETQKFIYLMGIIVVGLLLTFETMQTIRNFSKAKQKKKEGLEQIFAERRSCSYIEGDPTLNFLSIVTPDRAIYYHPQRTTPIEEQRRKEAAETDPRYWRMYDDLIRQGYQLKPCVAKPLE